MIQPITLAKAKQVKIHEVWEARQTHTERDVVELIRESVITALTVLFDSMQATAQSLA
jgi:hypothetical protein